MQHTKIEQLTPAKVLHSGGLEATLGAPSTVDCRLEVPGSVRHQ